MVYVTLHDDLDFNVGTDIDSTPLFSTPLHPTPPYCTHYTQAQAQPILHRKCHTSQSSHHVVCKSGPDHPVSMSDQTSQSKANSTPARNANTNTNTKATAQTQTSLRRRRVYTFPGPRQSLRGTPLSQR